MDKLKESLKPVLKQIFWIACGLILLAGPITWFLATSSLNKKFAANKTKIEGEFSKANGINNISDHPNKYSFKKTNSEIEVFQNSIGEAWQLHFDSQVGVLKWPEELQEDFTQKVDLLRPIESLTPAQELTIDFRLRYLNYIKEWVPKLADIIDSEWAANNRGGASGMGAEGESLGGGLGGLGRAGGGMSGMGARPAPGGAAKIDSVVIWSSSNQSAILSHFGFGGQGPSTKEILYAQEELWVYSAILEIIRKTNGENAVHHNAAIKEIKFINIGRDAKGPNGKVARVSGGGRSDGAGFGGAGGGMDTGSQGVMGMEENMMNMARGASEGGSGGLGASSLGGGAGGGMMGMGGLAASSNPADYRYVDNKFQPLSEAKLKSALASKNPQDAYLAVAKRMPVQLSLVMNQSKINSLLIQCGNSSLPLEVRQVRINRTSGSSMGGGGGMGMGMRSGGGLGGFGGDENMGSMGMGGSGMGGMGMGSGGGMTRSTKIGSSSRDIPVEIYGIIYIYNPVDKQKLGITASTADVAAVGGNVLTNGGSEQP